LRNAHSVLTFNHSDVENESLRVLRRQTSGRNVNPTRGSLITDTYQLSDISLILVCGCNAVDTGTSSGPDGYLQLKKMHSF